jgi:hypothetical protein
MLTIRFQATDGVGTYTPQDSQPCRLLQRSRDLSPTTQKFQASHFVIFGPIPQSPTTFLQFQKSAGDP